MRRSALLALLLLPVLAFAAGCGDKEEHVTKAESEGLYLDVGGLQYQVEISRQLNPTDVEDVAYLEGVPRSVKRLGSNESWFGIFLRVENHGDVARPAADSFELHDTQENVYTPVPIAASNPFSYQAGLVRAKEILPPNQSVAQLNESIAGSLVLFKVPNATYDNRPLELVIKDPRDRTKTASVDLDV